MISRELTFQSDARTRSDWLRMFAANYAICSHLRSTFAKAHSDNIRQVVSLQTTATTFSLRH